MRPTEYSKELEIKAREYIESFESNSDSIPSVVGLCKVINRARSTVYKWADEDDKKFSDILSELKEAQELALLNKGLSGEFNSTITKLILTKHGYSDKQETELSGVNGKPIEVDQNITVDFIDPSSDS